jgi:hypothetical protein
MAVPYENMTDEARRRQRQDRLRMREVWPRDTQDGRLYYESAKAIAARWEACEDAIVGLGGDERNKEDTAIGVLRQAVGQARQAYKRLDMAAKLGLNAVDKVFDRTAGVQDLDEEEEKLVKAFLKEEGSREGEKFRRKESMPQSHMTGRKMRQEECSRLQAREREVTESARGTCSTGAWVNSSSTHSPCR